jgi:hypothetical protein
MPNRATPDVVLHVGCGMYDSYCAVCRMSVWLRISTSTVVCLSVCPLVDKNTHENSQDVYGTNSIARVFEGTCCLQDFFGATRRSMKRKTPAWLEVKRKLGRKRASRACALLGSCKNTGNGYTIRTTNRQLHKYSYKSSVKRQARRVEPKVQFY